MRILFLSSVFPQPHDPTCGIYNLHLCQALAAEHEVKVIAPRPWLAALRSRWSREQAARNGYSPPAGLEIDFPLYYYPPGMLRGTYAPCMWASIRGRVRKLFERFVPDWVLSYWVYPDGDVAGRAARSVGARAAVIVGGSDVLLVSGRAWRRCVKVLRATDAVVTVGQHLKAKVVDLGIPPEKVHVVYQGVDTGLFVPGDRKEARRRLGIPVEGPVVLWVGRMVPVKGLDVLFEACAILRARGTDFRLYLVGDGPIRGRLEAEAKVRGLAGVLSFVGPLPPERLPDWYRAADLTVLPSRSEGVPNVLRESLACGTPFVASRVGGIPEIGTGSPCRLVPPGDPSTLADAIAQPFAEPNPTGPPLYRAVGWEESAKSVLRVLQAVNRPATGKLEC